LPSINAGICIVIHMPYPYTYPPQSYNITSIVSRDHIRAMQIWRFYVKT